MNIIQHRVPIIVKFLLKKITDLYLRYERHISSVSLLSGFIFTAFTLTRVDEFLENFWIIIHLVVAATGIILLNTLAKETPRGEIDESANEEEGTSERPDLHFWLTFIVQFSFGGLFSTFLVFYFRSATLATAWPFMLLLAATFIANERLRKHYSRLSFQITVLFISIYAFAIFIIPVLVHRMSSFIFILSGLVSLIILFGFLALLRLLTREKFRQSRKILCVSIGSIVLLMNVFYFTNLIPPIPLSLKDGGVYHSVQRLGDGSYELLYEKHPWYDYLRWFEPYHYIAGDQIFVFNSIFSPAQLNVDIVHRWQYFDENTHRWVTANIIDLGIFGGRENGFRTYSSKSNIFPALWRVDAETARGQTIGRVKFRVIASTEQPILNSKIK